MTRPMLSVALASLILLASGVSLLPGCEEREPSCAYREHPGHVDEYGQPDPCCRSDVPCCANPLWGRIAKYNGLDVADPCCLEVPCPFWDVNKGADAGPDGETPNKDPDTSPEAGMQEDAGADGGR